MFSKGVTSYTPQPKKTHRLTEDSQEPKSTKVKANLNLENQFISLHPLNHLICTEIFDILCEWVRHVLLAYSDFLICIHPFPYKPLKHLIFYVNEFDISFTLIFSFLFAVGRRDCREFGVRRRRRWNTRGDNQGAESQEGGVTSASRESGQGQAIFTSELNLCVCVCVYVCVCVCVCEIKWFYYKDFSNHIGCLSFMLNVTIELACLEYSLRSVRKSSQTWRDALSLRPCYRPSRIVTSFYRGKKIIS
jgi:hypothetical protein